MLAYIEEVGVTINTVPLGYKLPVRWVDGGNDMFIFLLAV